MITTTLNDQNHISENCIGSVIYFFTLTQVPFVYMERAGFMTCTAASHQGAIKEPQLHFSGHVRHTRVRDAFRISTWSLSRGLCFQVHNSWHLAVLLLVVIKQCCISAGTPFWIEGELPVFVVRPHAPNRDVHTVMVRYEYMYRSTPTL